MRSVAFGIVMGTIVARLYRREGLIISLAAGTASVLLYGLLHYRETRDQLT